MMRWFIGLLDVLFGKDEKPRPPPPEFRIVPNGSGAFHLERWWPNSNMYLVEKANVKDEAEARKIIAELRGEVTYID